MTPRDQIMQIESIQADEPPKIIKKRKQVKSIAIQYSNPVEFKDVSLNNFQAIDKRSTIEMFFNKQTVKYEVYKMLFPKGFQMLERGQAKTRAMSDAKITEVQSEAEIEENGP